MKPNTCRLSSTRAGSGSRGFVGTTSESAGEGGETGGSIVAAAGALSLSQSRANDSPGNGAPASRSSRSTTVAGRSRTLTVSEMTGRDGLGLRGGGTMTSGTWT